MTERDWRIVRGFLWLWLGIGLGIAIGTACPRVQAQTPGEVVALIDDAAAWYGLSAWETQRAQRIAACESGYRNIANRAGSGAVGIYQFMPATARAMGINPWDVEANVDAAIRLMAAGQWWHWRSCW